jgi:hypothetical protein
MEKLKRSSGEKMAEEVLGLNQKNRLRKRLGWVLNPVALQFIKNRSMGPHFGGGRVHL